jgi:hypothetical protein
MFDLLVLTSDQLMRLFKQPSNVLNGWDFKELREANGATTRFVADELIEMMK